MNWDFARQLAKDILYTPIQGNEKEQNMEIFWRKHPTTALQEINQQFLKSSTIDWIFVGLITIKYIFLIIARSIHKTITIQMYCSCR
jgi:hypothetical protein